MKAGRRTSWKTSSQRRSRSNAKGGTNDNVGIGNIAVSQYTKQLNPYKLSSSLRGSQGSTRSRTRGVSDENDLGLDDDDFDLGDDDDELGLENILSSIADLNNRQGDDDVELPSPAGASNKSDSGGNNDESSKPSYTTAPSSSAGGANNNNDMEEQQHQPPKMPHIFSPVDFGNEIANLRETPPIQNTNSIIDEPGNISPVSDGDIDTLWSDGDATRQHKLMVQTGQMVPAFSSGGFEDATSRMETTMITGPSFQTGVKSGCSLVGSSLVDSIIDELELTDQHAKSHISNQEPTHLPLTNNSSNALTPPRGGRFSYNKRAQAQTTAKSDTRANSNMSHANDAPQQSALPPKKSFSNQNNNPKKVLGSEIHNNTEDETLSTVTDPNEAPFIYTYKKNSGLDDDSVSQITSSLAGNSLGSARLQNVPTNFGSQQSHTGRNNRSGLSWMNNGTAGMGSRAGSRMIHRKAPGPYGRRGQKSANYTSATAGAASRGSSNSGSGSAGSGASYDGGNSNLDEIAYALNADCTAAPAGRKNPRTRSSRVRPPTSGRGGSARYTNVGSSYIPVHGSNRENGRRCDDLSTVESTDGFENGDDRQSSKDFIDTNLNSNVSRLGMGGVSCGAQSVSENTCVSESSASTQGLFQSLQMLAWTAQHHGGRFFFPTSPAVTQRKKFDRSDSMEDDLQNILLEEGANTLPYRKQRGSRHQQDDDDDDEDEIDYFSRAMSASNNHGTGLRKPKQRKKYCWNGRTARIGALLFVTVAVTVYYRMPNKTNGIVHLHNNQDEFRSGHERQFQDPNQEYGNDQVLDYATDAMVDSSKAYNSNGQQSAGIAGAGSRLGQPIENNMAAAASNSDSLASYTEERPQHFLVNGNIQLPSIFEGLANVDDLFQRGIDVPFYWHVPRSGGGTMNDVLGSCLQLTLAADAGGSEGRGEEQTLKTIHFSRQVSYVNVDTSTHQGISRAKKLNLVSSGLADVVISPLLHEASTLFTPTRRGRMFTIFRHPVERAASLFYFIQETQWRQPETRNDQFADITIYQFYKDGFAENNWMTRFLTNELTKGELTENDLTIAKEVLRQKCLVGLLEEKGETFERIQKYFGWRPRNEEQQNCLEKKLEWAWPMKHKHPIIEEDSREWRLILGANKLDMRLYAYAKELFAQQGQLNENQVPAGHDIAQEI
mmetsp:Transcript_475/g.944  ORF Transcript_475/g.944 Transcript_475/m.944 type:complete len:1172 (-) Transcript_475:117-3632(-)|eukprot:CAMPEP_0172327992 /NCGR_PEP_ID=MMETSP1058-20130122/60118_1 /TAXON_ID=83371 /ORGANISM="Detonula confervacea, Strain CCMP 353" /LENGTH=1171 /DNA_ID=CAMNT_0013045085 /DNA_START=132 /DNA_END=3650 /DNA_ORIENTATION=-